MRFYHTLGVGYIKAEVKNQRLLGILLLSTGLFNILDYYITRVALGMGYAEGNPVMGLIVGTGYFAWVKLVAVPLLLAGVWLIRGLVGHRLQYYAWVLFGCYGSLMVYFGWLFWVGHL